MLPTELGASTLLGARAIAITGRPRVGKTTLGKRLSEYKNGALVHTDDYIKDFSFEDAAKGLIDVCSKIDGPYIVEGVQVARMLRTGAREGIWQPDLVIVVDSSNELEKKHGSLAALVSKALSEWGRLSGVKTICVRGY